MNSLFKITTQTTLIITLLCLTGCSKETNEVIRDKSKYELNGNSYSTPYGIFLVNDTLNNPTFSNYTISFYTSNISYSFPDGQFLGYGSMISLDIDLSIFKTGTENQIFKIDNLQEGLLDVKEGNFKQNYDFSRSTGNETKIKSGVLTVWKYKNKYKINYKITLQDNRIIEGAFWDGLVIVYK